MKPVTRLCAVCACMAAAALSVAAQSTPVPGTFRGTLDPTPVADAPGPPHRIEGVVDIAGTRVRVSLPYQPGSESVGLARGMFGFDLNGDGRIDPSTEYFWKDGASDVLIVPVARHYVTVESADLAARVVVLRDHPASDYRVIDVRIGGFLPDFSFTDTTGRARTLAEFKGRVLLLDFWGSWCGPCLAEWPALKAARAKYATNGFEILGMDFEYSATPATVRALLVERGIEWPNASAESVKDLITNRFRVFGYPFHILLDREGRIAATSGTGLRGDTLDATLARLLK